MSAAQMKRVPGSNHPEHGGLPIELRGVEKSFGERRILHQFNLDVPAGQFLAVVGRSGGGKSTMMRLICGLDAPTRGRVMVGDVTVEAVHPRVRLLFQDARLVPWQRVLGNVGISRGEGWQAAAQEALVDVGLGERGGTGPQFCPVDNNSA